MFGRRCDTHRDDVGDEAACRKAVVAPIKYSGKPDTLHRLFRRQNYFYPDLSHNPRPA